MPRIFISYSHKDRTIAKRLVDSLRSAYGYDQVWFDENLSAGQVWRDELLTQIVQCDVFLFLISPDSIQSDYCKKELAHAQGARKPIIPLMVRSTPINALPHELEQSQILDVVSGISTPRFASLQSAIQLAAQKVAPPTPPQTTPDVNISGDYMLVGSISGSGIGKQVIDKQVNNYTNIPRTIIFVILLLIGLVALFVILNRPQAAPPDPKIAYEFLVDTSANMLTEINGIPRYQIANLGIRQIIDTPGSDTSLVYRALRLAGGGNQCNQTELVSSGGGNQVSVDDFIAPLSNIIPSGTNAIEAGINATFRDLDRDVVRNSDIKIVFILLGTFDITPCREFNIPAALAAYKQFGIETIFCSFTLSDDLTGFDHFQRQMLDRGFECIHNVETPEEISKVAISIIDKLVLQFKGQEIDLMPVSSPTQIVYLQPTNTPQLTATISTLPTERPSPTTQPSATNISTTFPTDTDTPTHQPSVFPTQTLTLITTTPVNTPLIPTLIATPILQATPTIDTENNQVQKDMETTQAAYETLDSQSIVNTFCTVKADGTNIVRVGPGENRAAIITLPLYESFTVLGQAAANDGTLWWKLDKQQVAPDSMAEEFWVAQVEVIISGSCNQVLFVPTPSIIINSPNSTPGDPVVGGGNKTIFIAIQGTDYPHDWNNQVPMEFRASSLNDATIVAYIQETQMHVDCDPWDRDFIQYTFQLFDNKQGINLGENIMGSPGCPDVNSWTPVVRLTFNDIWPWLSTYLS